VVIDLAWFRLTIVKSLKFKNTKWEFTVLITQEIISFVTVFVIILNHKTSPLTEPAAQNIKSSVNLTTFTLKYFVVSVVVLDTFYK